MADELNKKNQEIDKKEENNLPKTNEKKPLSKKEAILSASPLGATLLNNTDEEDSDPLASFFQEEKETEDEDDPLASFFQEEKETEDEDDPLASFFQEEKETEDEDDPLASFFQEEKETEDEDDPLASFFQEENIQDNEDDPLAAFFEKENVNSSSNLLDALLGSTTVDVSDNINTKKTTTLDSTGLFFGGNNLDGNDDDENNYKPFGIIGDIVKSSTSKPEPAISYKREKRKAKLDITKNSKEDQRTVERYTKKEVEDQLVADYKYMLGKSYMMIQPILIMADYPYKKKKNDSDIINEKNVVYDYVIALGKQLKWNSTEEYRRKPYKLGETMYIKRGIYWVEGNEMKLEPHFAIVLHRSYKRIKSRRVRDLFDPIRHRLRTGKPFSIYKEFPIIIKRTSVYS